MRRSKEIWYLLLFSLLIAAVTGWIMTAGRKEEKNSYTVSVIVNNSSDSRWTSLREGAEAAARDYNIRLNYVATGEFWGKQNELEIISKELESGVDGMIIQMYASQAAKRKMCTAGDGYYPGRILSDGWTGQQGTGQCTG